MKTCPNCSHTKSFVEGHVNHSKLIYSELKTKHSGLTRKYESLKKDHKILLREISNLRRYQRDNEVRLRELNQHN